MKITMLKYNFEEAIKRLTIQIVAPGIFIEPLKEALKVGNVQKYKEKLLFVFCEDVEDSSLRLNQYGNAPDFIAIILDPTNKTCIESYTSIFDFNNNEVFNIYRFGTARICRSLNIDVQEDRQDAKVISLLKFSFGFYKLLLHLKLCPKTQSHIEELKKAEENMRKIDSAYITGGRLCLVNGSCSGKYTDMGVGLGHINLLSKRHSVILINGDALIPEKCLHLALCITELATSVCGFFTGIPVVVDIPGYDEALG